MVTRVRVKMILVTRVRVRVVLVSGLGLSWLGLGWS